MCRHLKLSNHQNAFVSQCRLNEQARFLKKAIRFPKLFYENPKTEQRLIEKEL